MRQSPHVHQTDTTDLQFLEELTIRGPAGGRLRRALSDGDLPAARKTVAGHFRTRRAPAWSYWSHGSPWHQTDAVGSVLEKAQQLLQHRFRNSWPPHQWMDLHNSAASVAWHKGLASANTSIARGTWITELTTAFALTGDRRFARKALEPVSYTHLTLPTNREV